MKSNGEIQALNQLQLFTFKLRHLYIKDKNLFFELDKLIPFAVFVNKRKNLDITYANHQLLGRGKEMEELIEEGAGYLPKISNLTLLELAKQKTKNFGIENDKNGICNYLQQLTVNGKKEFFYSNKLILNEHLYFNVSTFIEDLGIVGPLFKTIFEPVKNEETTLQKLQLLTKQEKRIVSLLINGYSHRQVAEILFISRHTMRTHIRNIHRKMDTNNTAQLIKLGMLMELL